MQRTKTTHQLVSMMAWLAVALAAAAIGGCLAQDLGEQGLGAEGDDVGDDDDDDNDDCKIEDGDIGSEGVAIELGDRVVTVSDWVAKGDSPGEYVGFSLSVSDGSGVGYVVKTGGDLWHSTGTTWMHPLGAEGPDVSAISNVDFCEECEEDGSCDDGDDGDDECTDPSGCEGDGGDGGDGGDECVSDDECATGEFCEGGTCQPIVL